MRLIFATSNLEKLKEAKLALQAYGFEVIGMDFNFIEPFEGTMEDIAKIKLSQIGNEYTEPIFVDDSGIFFKEYNNFPGVITKRIFKLIGYKGIKKLLTDANREAYFRGVVALKWKGEIKIFSGETTGKIVEEIPTDLPTGLQFPFDPIFIPDGSEITMAEMSQEYRLNFSYRRKALDKMGLWLESQFSLNIK